MTGMNRFSLVFILLSALRVDAADPPAAPAPAPASAPTNPPPTIQDLAYDEHDLTKLDFWRAEGEGPRPLYIFIHGGGWTSGDKAERLPIFQPFLKRGISCASINYRLTPGNPLPTPVHDAARAIQFLRSRADELGIRKDRIVLTGGSAGACTSLWLACHDDLADPDSADPVARESTRVQGAFANAGQTSIDPPQILDWLGPKVLDHRMTPSAVGAKDSAEAMANYAQYEPLYKEFSPWNHVSSDDPPLLLSYDADTTLPSKDAGHGIHHPVYGVKMKERCDSVGQECHLFLGGVTDSKKYSDATSFVLAILLAE